MTGTIASTAGSDTPYSVTVTASDGTHTASDTFNWTVARKKRGEEKGTAGRKREEKGTAYFYASRKKREEKGTGKKRGGKKRGQRTFTLQKTRKVRGLLFLPLEKYAVPFSALPFSARPFPLSPFPACPECHCFKKQLLGVERFVEMSSPSPSEADPRGSAEKQSLVLQAGYP